MSRVRPQTLAQHAFYIYTIGFTAVTPLSEGAPPCFISSFSRSTSLCSPWPTAEKRRFAGFDRSSFSSSTSDKKNAVIYIFLTMYTRVPARRGSPETRSRHDSLEKPRIRVAQLNSTVPHLLQRYAYPLLPVAPVQRILILSTDVCVLDTYHRQPIGRHLGLNRFSFFQCSMKESNGYEAGERMRRIAWKRWGFSWKRLRCRLFGYGSLPDSVIRVTRRSFLLQVTVRMDSGSEKSRLVIFKFML